MQNPTSVFSAKKDNFIGITWKRTWFPVKFCTSCRCGVIHIICAILYVLFIMAGEPTFRHSWHRTCWKLHELKILRNYFWFILGKFHCRNQVRRLIYKSSISLRCGHTDILLCFILSIHIINLGPKSGGIVCRIKVNIKFNILIVTFECMCNRCAYDLRFIYYVNNPKYYSF